MPAPLLPLLLLLLPLSYSARFPCGSAFFPCPSHAVVSHRGRPPQEKSPDSPHKPLMDMDPSFPPPLALDRDQMMKAVEEAADHVAYIINITEKTAPLDTSTLSHLAWFVFFGADPVAKNLSQSMMLAERMTSTLMEMGHSMPSMTGSLPPSLLPCPIVPILDCIPGKYRSYTGHCNNPLHPQWGSAHEAMTRFLPPQYDDVLSSPRDRSSSGSPLPSPSSVSFLFSSHLPPPSSLSLFIPQWASFIFDDMSSPVPNHINGGRSSLLPCCRRSFSHPECLPLRQNDSRLLLMEDSSDPLSLPRSSSEECRRGKCLEGRGRMNGAPSSAALYSVWIRHHNNVARALKKVNVHWTDERLFQEGRRVVVAQIQHITYAHFLPKILGIENINKFELATRSFGYDSNYNMTLDPTLLNEFSSAAGLFFLAFLPDRLGTVDVSGVVHNERPIGETLLDPSLVHFADGLEGTSSTVHSAARPCECLQIFWEGELGGGMDVASWMVQMGRDHGLAAYGEYREECRLPRRRDWAEAEEDFLSTVDMGRLRSLYPSPSDMDLFVAAMAEKPLPGALVGPTLVCILARQFYITKRGDRFWYENFVLPSALTEKQLREIRKTSLSSILCQSTGGAIGRVQTDVFLAPDEYSNFPMECNSTAIKKMEWSAWKDSEPQKKFPVTKELLEKALTLGLEQYNRLQEAEGRQQKARGPPTRSSSAFTHSALMAPKQEALDLAVTAGVLRETTKIILNGNVSLFDASFPPELDVSTLQTLLPEIDVSSVIGNFRPFLARHSPPPKEFCLPQPQPCDHTRKFRSASGWCNNIRFPHYGNAFQPLRRLLPPVYDDGFDSPRTLSHGGGLLPSARRVSSSIHSDSALFHSRFTHMLMQYGQILDHDMMHSPIARGPSNSILNCSSCDSASSLSIHCFPIQIDDDDAHFPSHHADGSKRCMPFTRSLLGQVKLGYRNQLNQLSSFLDASTVYGSTECEVNRLRLFKGGKLNFTDLGYNREALPQGDQERDCRSLPSNKCFVAGDERSNEQPGLTVLHTIFMREHNRMAEELGRINVFWDDERIFQETRRVFIAKLQHITYSEWLPIVLGNESMAKYGLIPKTSGYFSGYDDNADATVSQEVSTAAFRFGHTLIRNTFPRMNSSFANDTSPINLKDVFNSPQNVYERQHGHVESILMGLVGASSMAFDRHIVEAVRNHLFQRPGGPLTGLDLPAVNIQRGRDHGIPPYNEYRQLCGLPRARSFFDLHSSMTADSIRALSSVYAHVDDIDAFPGMMSERPLPGALVGQTLGCLIGEQMKRLKDGDRFYYENDVEAVRFSEGQLSEIRHSSLAKMLCSNSYWAEKIQPNVFLLPDQLTNSPVSCADLPTTDMEEWAERQFCVVDHGVISAGATKRVTPCVSCTCTSDGTECHAMTIPNCSSLTDEFEEVEILKDTVCVIQCGRWMASRRA